MLQLTDARAIDKTLTQADIDALEQKVRTLTNNKFHHQYIKSYNLAIQDNYVTSAYELIGFKVGDRVEIVGTKFNDGLYTITDLDEHTLTLDKDLTNETEKYAFVTKIDYPVDISQGLKEVIKYQSKMANKVGVKSERVSRTSVTYNDVNTADNKEGIPSSYWSFLNKYRKLRW